MLATAVHTIAHHSQIVFNKIKFNTKLIITAIQISLALSLTFHIEANIWKFKPSKAVNIINIQPSCINSHEKRNLLPNNTVAISGHNIIKNIDKLMLKKKDKYIRNSAI